MISYVHNGKFFNTVTFTIKRKQLNAKTFQRAHNINEVGPMHVYRLNTNIHNKPLVECHIRLVEF